MKNWEKKLIKIIKEEQTEIKALDGIGAYRIVRDDAEFFWRLSQLIEALLEEQKKDIVAEFYAKAVMDSGSLRGGEDTFTITKKDLNVIRLKTYE